MNIKTIIVIALTGQIVACGSIESDFVDTLNDDANSKICFSEERLGVKMWQVENKYYLVAKKPDRFMGDSNQVMALEALKENGYVKTEPFVFKAKQFFGPTDTTGYEITGKGSKYFSWDEKVCIGERIATEITEYTEPTENKGMTFTQAKYSYEIKLNDLIDDLEIENDLRKSNVGKKWDGIGNAIFVKTNKGWRLEGADW